MNDRIAATEQKAADLAGALRRQEAIAVELRVEAERAASAGEERARRLETALEEKDRALTGMDLRLTAATETRARLEAGLDTAEAKLDESRRLLSEARERLTALAAERDRIAEDLAAKIDGEVARHAETADALARREAEIADLQRTMEGIEARSRSAVDQEAALKQHVRALEDQFQEIRTSTSWRVTAPLRFVGRFAQWFITGAWAWLSLRPGSRPHRVWSALKSASRAERRRSLLSAQSRRMTVASGPKASIDLYTEPKHVRVLYERLIHARDHAPTHARANYRSRPALAYLSPLPPERSGISDYSAELLPELSKHYSIDVIVQQSRVSDPWIEANCNVRNIDWFEKNAYTFDRFLYHVGNSPFHHHMFPLLERFPGIVVLHDFFLGHLLAFLDLEAGRHGYWSRALQESHGYAALEERFKSSDLSEVVFKYPANLFVLQQAQGVIVHSNHPRQLAEHYFGDKFGSDWFVVPHVRRLPELLDRAAARRNLGFADNEFVVCAFGATGQTKLNRRLVSAWSRSRLATDENCRLIFVGELQRDQYCALLSRDINLLSAADRVRVTGFVPMEIYRQYLQAADVAVQLRTRSRGETSGAILDCMAFGVPTIVNANGSAAELPQDCVLKLPDEFSDQQLSDAMTSLWKSASQ